MASFFSFLLPLLSIIFLFISSAPFVVEGSQFTKLFVIGDSYVDTGNSPISNSQSWEVPYGKTFPGHPTGRFSDGRVLTDFIAKHIGLERTPMAYRWRDLDPEKTKLYGMNFAVGGTGVFNTSYGNNYTLQIGRFEEVIKNGTFYTPDDIRSSLVYVELSGNDYLNYLTQTHFDTSGLLLFLVDVVAQLALDLHRIHALGVGKVAVSTLSPVGCIPGVTISTGHQACIEDFNFVARVHNRLLNITVDLLNWETQSSDFVVVDLYSPFNSVINGTVANSKFKYPLEPCCVGVEGVDKSYCATVDDKGNPTYTVCPNPESAFYWDMVHLTQAGWETVSSLIKFPF